MADDMDVGAIEDDALNDDDEENGDEVEEGYKMTKVSGCVGINQCVGCTDNSSLSHFSATTRPSWLGRAVRNRHRQAIEQASRRWRGCRRDDSGQTRRKILISTQTPTCRRTGRTTRG